MVPILWDDSFEFLVDGEHPLLEVHHTPFLKSVPSRLVCLV
jgi:hypothetical protein